MKPPLRLVVGFVHYADLQALEAGISEHNRQGDPEFRIVGATQEAQQLFDDALTLDADAALLCPEIRGYRDSLIPDLLAQEKPVPTIGLTLPTGDEARRMEIHGARGNVLRPLDPAGVAWALRLIETAVAAVQRERQEGRLSAGVPALPADRQGSWQARMLTLFVPKGGGSTRTTLAVNLAVGLSHRTLGHQPTALVDLDMTKGDCHTLLGYTVDPDSALRQGRPLLDRGLFDLVLNVVAQGEAALTPALLRQFLVHWGGADSQLDLLPGLARPHQSGAPEFADWARLYALARRLLQEIRRLYPFVVIDIGQDYNLPLHRAALEEADEVLVPVPPLQTALVDTAHALPPLKATFGTLNKFKLILTAYDPLFGISEKEIVDAVGLPKLVTIPHDARTAHLAANTATPFVLSDRDGPLGAAIRSLVRIYLPYVDAEEPRHRGLHLKRLLVRET